MLQLAVAGYAQEKKAVNSLGMEFVLIPAGMFIMGSPIDEAYRGVSEIQHQVTITRPFYMQTTEVTVDQWRAVMGKRFLARKKGSGDMPVVKVSWHDCNKFIRKLNKMTGDVYQLPTEAQWEYVARAGSTDAYFWGAQIDCTRAMFANNPMKYDGCVSTNTALGLKLGRPAPVKRYPPNAWGLYDMHGNAWEWCEDRFDQYDAVSVVDPCETESGQDRVRRGGSWFGSGYSCRSANRAYGHPMSRLQNTGFRLVMALSAGQNDTSQPQ
ncbi:MAG: formylglycine-generating enzyme family protein [Desulfosarcina sp.]|nr:formylglycine-generating enzyme family protein [Desulfosarcina sp.]MBC2741786.1 formylglycine-generating enzyme family protein [Desulfosarcina sp.]MBC2764700.1 formylglycine-generating enzyme family protein [Desulfosarcina sp.]